MPPQGTVTARAIPEDGAVSPSPPPAAAGRGTLDAYGRAHRDAMVARHAPLVRRLALRLASRLPASVSLDDLVQAGMMGLLDAVTRYREVPTAQFETYATQRIRGAMLDELRSTDWAPRGVRERARRIENAIHRTAQALGREPSEAEVAAALDVSLREYQAMLQEAHGAQLIYADELGSGLDALPGGAHAEDAADASAQDPLQALLGQEQRAALVQAIDALPEREKLLLSLSYEQGLNLKEIGLVLNVGEARVCQLRSQAIARLRARLARG
ncbi:RNA polymerase sigma factor FliA [Verticiella sediminum]|uniref:RNA polymerase sigma factor FliA n=2 Tax=Verticiella sediminum TaxID=1247510 RepID=A0A556ATV3_9BURK|nr:RNA polymerase sigma factor FliA [Verticiella sediminum]